MRPRLARRVLTLAGISTLYFVAGKIGLSLAVVHESATAVWPAAGVAVAALLITGIRAWPAVALGALLAKFAARQGRVTVSVVSGPDSVELTIDDDGPGFPPDFLPHVFEQFRQADGSLTREHGGLGLGLAIAHHLVALHHGTIEARNRDGGGASFVVRLPRYLGAITGAPAVAWPASVRDALDGG